MEAHPLCRILPEMPESEYRPLVADIRAKGLMRPITTFEGMILDGRHRFKACVEAGITPRFEPYTGTDPIGFVQSCCTHRSLNQTQRAMVAAGFLAYEQEQARKRQSALNGKSDSMLSRNVGEAEKGRSDDRAGARMAVSGDSVRVAAKVLAKAASEVVAACKSGDMALNEAKRMVDLNPKAQRRIASLPKKERAREIEIAHSRSVACKRRDNPAPAVQQPGTPFVRTLLSGVERLAMVAAEQGMKTGGAVAATFIAEMDWESAPLLAQLEKCEPIIRALSVIQQHKTTKAA